MGDFNYPEIKWVDNEVSSGINTDPFKFYECMQNNFLFQHICTPTRFRTGQNANLLDLVFTNEENMIAKDSIQMDSPVGKSDHCMITFDFCCYLNNENTSGDRFSYFRGNYELFNETLNDIDWDVLLNNKSINEMWKCFSSVMSDNIDRFIPKKKTDRKFISPPLWMDRATKSAIVKKRKSWKKYKYSRNNLSYVKYVKDRNECTNAVKNAKLSFEQKVALESKTNVKSFWNYVNSKLKTRSGIGTLEKPDGTLASSTADKVEVLNQFFTSVFTQTEDLKDYDTNSVSNNFLNDINICQEDVLKKLNKLKTDKSAGPDGLHPKVLYEVRHAICYPLFLIFNKSIKRVKFQTIGKMP
ncbi:Hypothetical predicted protein [Mytilus galloprovincialis]|uniref:Endonuclease/exonuclease/phosphatase domain-containing protein n=1 Tax=Mytilus galloprovincialis TaxID=29158 RepID=A0A8B6CSY6_MYTGA|nr:Hypothetical predicted protein [Mytilus galloprovincialis]